MGVDHRMDHLHGLRAALSLLTAPLDTLAELPALFSGALTDQLVSRSQLVEENRRLHEENQKLLGRMLRFDALEEENIRLRGQLGAALKLGDRVSLAEIAALDLDPNKHQVIINKGNLAGVFPGQAVVDARAVMGQVTHVSPFSSSVLLITDASHSIPVRVLRNGLRTIAVGTGKIDRLELPYVLPNADIQAGDLLVTSGLGGHFPPGYPVARVVSVDTSLSGLFGKVTAEPLAGLGRAQEVMLVWSIDAAMPRTLPAATAEASGSENAGNADAQSPPDQDEAAEAETVR